MIILFSIAIGIICLIQTTVLAIVMAILDIVRGARKRRVKE